MCYNILTREYGNKENEDMKTKAIRALTALLAATVIALSACGFSACGDEPEEFLPDYDISAFEVYDDVGDPMVIGGAYFRPMELTDGDFTMKYRIYVPDFLPEGEPMPVLMFFHGAGERGSDNTAQVSYEGLAAAIENSDALYSSVIIAPQCPSGMRWVDFPDGESIYSTDEVGEGAPLVAALKLLKYYDGRLDIDRGGIYAAGISMGGYATWDILVRHAGLVDAAVPICGGCDTSKYERLTDTRIYTFHGALDPIVSPEGTRAMYELLKGYGNIEYTEYADGYHDIWNYALSTEGLFDKVYNNDGI